MRVGMNNPLGRIVNHDTHNREYAIRRTRASRRSVLHTFAAPNVDQFYTSGCVGFAGANFLNTTHASHARRKMNDWMRQQMDNHYLGNDAGLENYHQATVYDPFPWQYPPTDEGSSALGLVKFWKKVGIIAGYEWAFTFNQFCAALEQQPVLVGTKWYQYMTDLNGLHYAIPSGENQGGHEYLAIGINWHNRTITCENSWGENWGNRGRFYMTFERVEALLADDGDCCIPRVA